MSETGVAPAIQYCNCMEDIKTRLNKVSRILLGHSPMKDEGFDGEVACLLIRKVLEQIAFSTLVANKAAYESVYADFAKTWRVKRLLDRMRAVHPNFYPKPVTGPVIGSDGVKHFVDVVESFLTLEEFEFLYDKCSEVLHTWNPYRTDPRVVNFERPLSEWVSRIQRLLDMHYVALAGRGEVWLVQMVGPLDGKAHAYMAVSA